MIVGAVLAIVLTIAAPGLAIVAVVVIVVLAMLCVWFASERLLRRLRARADRHGDRSEAPRHAER